MSKRKKQDRGQDRDSRHILVDLDDPTVRQVARVFRALGLRLELWTEPLTRQPATEPDASEPVEHDDPNSHVPALHPTANPRAWAVYCLGCSTDAHPGVYPCRRDDAPDYWHRLPPQLS